MNGKYIQLWASGTLRSDLARLASVSESIAVDITTGQKLEFNRAGIAPNHTDAKLVYDGLREHVALIAVGNTIIKGDLTMAGTKMDEAGMRAWDGVRNKLYGSFHRAAAMAGSFDHDQMAQLAASDPDVQAKKEFFQRSKSFNTMLRDSRYESRYG
jgi:hypothetical protein